MKWIENLKRIMSDKGINIEQLKNKIEANGSTLSRNSISNILNGNNNPKIETLEVIARALNLEVWQFFTDQQASGPEGKLYGVVVLEGKPHQIQSMEDLERLLELAKA